MCILTGGVPFLIILLNLRPDRGFIYKIESPFSTFEDTGNQPGMVPEQWSSGFFCPEDHDSSSAILCDPFRLFPRIPNTIFQSGLLVLSRKFVMRDKENY